MISKTADSLINNIDEYYAQILKECESEIQLKAPNPASCAFIVQMRRERTDKKHGKGLL